MRFNSRYVLGLVSISCVVLIWTFSSFFIEYYLIKYKTSFLFNYVAISGLQLYFPIFCLIRCVTGDPKETKTHKVSDIEEEATGEALSKKELVILSLQFFTLYFFACYFSNTAFEYTDVISASTILATSSFFTLIIGILLKVEICSVMKIIAMLFCAAGVFIIGVFGPEDPAIVTKPQNPILGNAFALSSAFLYGLYSTVVRKTIKNEKRIEMSLFFGLVGFFSMTLLWPLIIILHTTGVEQVVLPSPEDMLYFLVFVLVGALISNYLWLLSVLYLSPLAVAMGTTLCTPLTILINHIIRGEEILNVRSIAGIFIFVGFLIVNVSNTNDKFCCYFENLLCKDK